MLNGCEVQNKRLHFRQVSFCTFHTISTCITQHASFLNHNKQCPKDDPPSPQCFVEYNASLMNSTLDQNFSMICFFYSFNQTAHDPASTFQELSNTLRPEGYKSTNNRELLAR